MASNKAYQGFLVSFVTSKQSQGNINISLIVMVWYDWEPLKEGRGNGWGEKEIKRKRTEY